MEVLRFTKKVTGNMDAKELAAFAKHYLYAFPKLASGNQCPPHIKYMADEIQFAISQKTIKDRLLIINIGPRFGKTELISKHFVCWYLGNNPKKE